MTTLSSACPPSSRPTSSSRVALPKDSDNTEAVSSAIRALDTDGTLDDLSDKYLRPLFAEDPDHVRAIVTPAED